MEGVAEAEAARSEREAHYAQHEQLYLECAVGLRSALFATPSHSLTSSTFLHHVRTTIGARALRPARSSRRVRDGRRQHAGGSAAAGCTRGARAIVPRDAGWVAPASQGDGPRESRARMTMRMSWHELDSNGPTRSRTVGHGGVILAKVGPTTHLPTTVCYVNILWVYVR